MVVRKVNAHCYGSSIRRLNQLQKTNRNTIIPTHIDRHFEVIPFEVVGHFAKRKDSALVLSRCSERDFFSAPLISPSSESFLKTGRRCMSTKVETSNYSVLRYSLLSIYQLI